MTENNKRAKERPVVGRAGEPCSTCCGIGKVRGAFDTNEYTGEPLPADDCPICDGSGIEPPVAELSKESP